MLLNKVTGYLLPGHLSALVRARPAEALKVPAAAVVREPCKSLLRTLDLIVRAGRQMGPSGSSKTTLLGNQPSPSHLLGSALYLLSLGLTTSHNE